MLVFRIIMKNKKQTLGFLSVLFVLASLSSLLYARLYWKIENHTYEQYRKQNQLIANTGRILLLDEVLTMSAKMAAATGDEKYERRYHQFGPELDRLIL